MAPQGLSRSALARVVAFVALAAVQLSAAQDMSAATAVDCRFDQTGCMTGLTFHYEGQPAQTVSCSSAGASTGHVRLAGDHITGYSVATRKWGAGGALQRCVSSITFETSAGRRLTCGAGAPRTAAHAAAPLAAAKLAIPAQPAAAKARSALSALAAVKVQRCQQQPGNSLSQPAFNFIKPVWCDVVAPGGAASPEAIAAAASGSNVTDGSANATVGSSGHICFAAADGVAVPLRSAAGWHASA